MLVFGCVFAEQMQEKSEFDDEFAQPNEIFDPLGGYNRMMTGFNDFIYTKAIHPAIKGYNYVVPEPARTAAGNFFDNLLYPVRFVNNLLQLKFSEAGEETLRFLANTMARNITICNATTRTSARRWDTGAWVAVFTLFCPLSDLQICAIWRV